LGSKEKDRIIYGKLLKFLLTKVQRKGDRPEDARILVVMVFPKNP